MESPGRRLIKTNFNKKDVIKMDNNKKEFNGIIVNGVKVNKIENIEFVESKLRRKIYELKEKRYFISGKGRSLTCRLKVPGE